MQKIIFSLLCALIMTATVLSSQAVAYAIPIKGGILITPTPTMEIKKAPDFVLATPTPTPDFKKVAPSITLATPTPDFVKTPATLPPASTPQILEGVTLATATPTPDFKKIPATLPPTATPKILEGVTRVSPTPAAESKPSSPPEITKHPGAEVVDAGRNCSFVAYANNYDSISWYFKNGDSKINADDAAASFTGLSITDSNTTKIRLFNVPAGLNGWEIGATFTNSAGSVNTNTCSITVNGGTAATPAPTPTPTPEATAVPETPAPAESPAAGTAEAPASDPEPAATAAPAPVPTEAHAEERSGSILPIILGCIVVVTAAACAAFFAISNKGRKGKHYTGKH